MLLDGSLWFPMLYLTVVLYTNFRFVNITIKLSIFDTKTNQQAISGN